MEEDTGMEVVGEVVVEGVRSSSFSFTAQVYDLTEQMITEEEAFESEVVGMEYLEEMEEIELHLQRAPLSGYGRWW